MSPEVREKFQALERQIEEMRSGRDLQLNAAISRFVVGNTLTVVDADQSAADLNTVADSVNVAKDYDFKLIIRDSNGNEYNIGRYE